MRIEMQHGDEVVLMEVEPEGACWRVRLPDGSVTHIVVLRRAEDVLQIAISANTREAASTSRQAGERMFRVPFARSADQIEFAYQGLTYVFRPPAPKAVAAGPAPGVVSGALTAPLSGIVADVLVTEGQTVEAYQPLVVLEAMKVMTTLEAPFAGTVASLAVQKKQQIAQGAPVVEITRKEN